MGKSARIKILIWHMVGEMVETLGRARFYLSCNYSCTLYHIVKVKEVKLKKLHTLAYLNLNYGRTKQK